MTYYLVKIAVTTVLIVAISEIAKRSSLIGAIIASRVSRPLDCLRENLAIGRRS